MVIRVLPSALANQIAAGEVVERPASVLKELIENSLDAGAATISVQAEGGGIGLLRVRDDGVGMAASDLALALSRHATSKIDQLADLQCLRSMGFRGEALPSIASVSRLELTSRERGQSSGWSVQVNGSADVSAPRPAAHPQGCTVTVRDLFFNTPARRKFLRTPRTELRQVDEVFRRLALGRTDVAMSLAHEGRNLLTLPAGVDEAGQERRLARLFGRAFMERAARIDVHSEDMRLSGWIGVAGYDRAQADCQYFYVNDRAVRDGLLRHALRMAFEGLLASGRHPAYALYLALDPATMDVNVHPTKHELRFSQARLVHDFVHRMVERVLHPSAFAAVAAGGPERGGDRGDNDTSLASSLELQLEPAPPGPGSPAETNTRAPNAAALTAPALSEAVAEAQGDSYRSAGYAAPRLRSSMARSSSRSAPPQSPVGNPLGAVLTLVEGRALLVRSGTGLLVLDYGAARQAAWLDKLREAADGAQPDLVTRPLLLPAVVATGEAVAALVEQAEAGFSSLGIELRRIGPREVSLRALPAMMADLEPVGFASALVHRLACGPPAAGTVKDIAAALVDCVQHALQATGAGLGGAADVATLDASLRELLNILGEDRLRSDFSRALSGPELLDLLPRGGPRSRH